MGPVGIEQWSKYLTLKKQLRNTESKEDKMNIAAAKIKLVNPTIFLHNEIPDKKCRFPNHLDNLTYQKGVSNAVLKLRLLNEQKNFCAYTEKYIESGIDADEVEHFNPGIKYSDDYFNYYTTLRSANQRKISKYKEHRNAGFFKHTFLSKYEEFNARIKYEDFVYESTNEEDNEAKAL